MNIYKKNFTTDSYESWILNYENKDMICKTRSSIIEYQFLNDNSFLEIFKTES